MKNYQGFTLIELVIVVAIIGILSSIAMPAYLEYVQRGARSDATSILMDLAAQQEDFFSQNSTYTTDVSSAAGLGLGNNLSLDGYYTLTSAACTGGVISNCFLLTATALASNSQINDLDCRTMSLNSVGIKTATDSGGNANANCW